MCPDKHEMHFLAAGFYYHQDWVDIRTILERQKGKLSIDYILESLHPLCELKEAPKIEERLKSMLGIIPKPMMNRCFS